MILKKTLILLFEDREERRVDLQRELQSRTIEVIAPSSRYEVLDLVRAEPIKYDLILLDFHFSVPDRSHPSRLKGHAPVPDGIALCKSISEINPRIPVVLYGVDTNHLPDEEKALANGAYRVIAIKELPSLIEELRGPLRELVEIANSLAEIQQNRRTMGHVVAGLGVGFQVVDTRGRIWFRDQEFLRIVGESGRPHMVCDCKTRGYRYSHGMCVNCLIQNVIKSGEPDFHIFYSPTFPDGPRNAPVFQYLGVRVSPIRRLVDDEPVQTTRKGLAAIEAVSQIPYGFIMQSMNLKDHLAILARALADVGFMRVRIFRARPLALDGRIRATVVGLCFLGAVQENVQPESVMVELKDEPVLNDNERGAFSKIVEEADFVVRTPDLDAKLLRQLDNPPLLAALFSGNGAFVGWVAVDNATFSPDEPPMSPAQVSDFQADGGSVGASAVLILDEIARAISAKSELHDLDRVDVLQAEKVFQAIRLQMATKVDVTPSELLHAILEAVCAEVPQVKMAHVRSYEDHEAKSVAFVGDYGKVAQTKFNTFKSERLTAKVAASGVPEFINDIASLKDKIPGYHEFSPEQRDLLVKYPSHGVYPLLSEDKTIGTVSFQSVERSFFKGYRQALFQMVANLLSVGLRDYRNYLREEQAIAADLGQRVMTLVLHNINHPVATIRDYIHLAKKAIGKPIDSTNDLQRYLNHIDKQCSKIANIRAHFANLFGPVKESPFVFDLRNIVHEILLDSGLQDRGVRSEIQSTLSQSLVESYPHLFEVAITVLVRNSLDALAKHDRDKTLTVVIREPAKDVSDERPFFGNCLAIDVIDSGPGLTEDVRADLFTALMTGRRNGWGIGLAYARDMVRSFGGDLYFAELDPRGTRFTLLMPAITKNLYAPIEDVNTSLRTESDAIMDPQ